MLLFLKQMLQLVLSPRRGWEDVAKSAESPRHTLIYGLLPMIGLAAITTFFGMIYDIEPSAGRTMILAVVTFAKYSVAYFVGVAALAAALPWLTIDGLVDRTRVETFCAYCIGLMAITGVLENLLPMELSLLQFLPLYFIGVMVMGRAYLNVDENNIFKFTALNILSLILPVYLIARLMSSAM